MDQIIKTIDNDMTPRFGHTLTLVCKTKGQEKAILFGINKLILNIASGTVPNPRAAHAACSPSENQLIIYGGATGCK